LRELDSLYSQKVRTGRPHSRYVLDERDAIMCTSLCTLALHSGVRARAGSGNSAAVFAIVGAAHVEPITELWRELCAPAARERLALAASAAMHEPTMPSDRSAPDALIELGARYGLLDAIYAPSARPSRHLPPLSGAAAEAHRCTLERYSSADMQLAMLSREELLAHVLRDLGARVGNHPEPLPAFARMHAPGEKDGSDIEARAHALTEAVWESLEPMRQARPGQFAPRL